MPRKRRNESQRCQFAKEAYNTTRIYSSITIFLLNYLFFLILKLASVPSWFSDHLHFTLYEFTSVIFFFGLEKRIYFGISDVATFILLPILILYLKSFVFILDISTKHNQYISSGPT